MALESRKKIKVLEEYIEILKQDLFFSMAERKRKPENTKTHSIITIKRELDNAVQERMKLSQIYYGNINDSIAPTAASA
jgi:hypothetical protein